MNHPVDVSQRVFDFLLEGFPHGTAASLISDTRSTTDPFLHPGDPFGEVLCWLWTSGKRDEATSLVQGFHAVVDTVDHPATWEQLLSYLPFAIKTPQWISEADYQELMEHLRSTPPTHPLTADGTTWHLDVSNPETAIFGTLGTGKSHTPHAKHEPWQLDSITNPEAAISGPIGRGKTSPVEPKTSETKDH